MCHVMVHMRLSMGKMEQGCVSVILLVFQISNYSTAR
ncbi:hypothetical protein BRAO285_1230062 [Bradyrhizobium sp. ORS 285]|nr:hypothetical protein BRAO285_1230062 [Bradyrhizobium sp. ORS 285]